MRRTINKQPMSLQEVAERKEQAEQRIHAADGLVATAEQNHAAIVAEHNTLALKLEDLDAQIADREFQLSGFEASCKEAADEKRKLEAEVAALKQAYIDKDIEMGTLCANTMQEHERHLESNRAELEKMNEAKNKVRAEFDQICTVVEERKQKNASLVAIGAKLSAQIMAAQLEIESLEPKKAELYDLNLTILARKDAIVGISEEYAAKVEEVAAVEAKLVEAKAATEQEVKRAQAVREDLAVREAEVEQKLTSLKAVQENLETMRTRMQRAEQDAKAKEFLNKGY